MDDLKTIATSSVTYIQQQPLALIVVTLVVISITTRLLSGNVVSPAPDPDPSADRDGARTAPAVPYWLPFIGHLPQIVLYSDSFLSRLRKLHPTGYFSLNVFGGVHTVIFRPGLIAALMNKPSHIADATGVAKYLMMANFGYPRRESDRYDKMLPDIVAQYHKLSSEPSLGNMVDRTVQILRHNISEFVTFNESPVDQAEWERLSETETTENRDGETVVEANLFDLVRNFVAITANPCLMGTNFVDNFPEFWRHLWTFDAAFLPMMADLPRWVLYPSVIRARRARGEMFTMIREFEVAMETDRNGGYPGAKWCDLDSVGDLIQGRVDEVYKKYDMSIEERTACEFTLLWATNANSNPLVFWMLWRIYSDADLLARIRAEVAPFVVPEDAAGGFGPSVSLPTRIDKIDVDGLATKCPLIKAAYIETLRVDVTARSFKVIQEDVVLGERDSAEKLLLRKGTYAHAVHDLHHTNPECFDNPKEWRVDRHIKWDATNEKGEKTPTVDMGTVRPYGESGRQPAKVHDVRVYLTWY